MKKEITTKARSIEFLSINELLLVKGGSSEDKNKTKETDVYDTRDI